MTLPHTGSGAGPSLSTCHLPSGLLQFAVGWAPCLCHQTPATYPERCSPPGVQPSQVLPCQPAPPHTPLTSSRSSRIHYKTMIVEINSVEVDMHTLLSEQAEALLSRRREAIQQESSRLQQLSYATDPHCEGDSGESVNGKQNKIEPGEKDYGSLPADSELSPKEEAELQKGRAEILSRSQGVFCDVQEDFWEVKKVLSRFDEWRGAFSESYHPAYISLCLPKLLNPLIRHQLLGWNPLHAAGEDFEALPWCSAVETVCHGLGYQEAEHTDRKTLPAIIEKTLLPKIQGFVALVWDPLSSRQSVCLSELCRRLQDDYSLFEGKQSKPVKAFVEAVSGRLGSSVDDDIFIPHYPKKFLDDRSSPQRRSGDQQFWTAMKLLGNMGQWDGLIPEHALKELMLDKLLNPLPYDDATQRDPISGLCQ
ncbi:hypothetical protein J4Q44_G00227340 [Coregonus suidteri]|uniref:GCF C-terminal domain-containing protein n=1 Tax=Coregonus suidteri TaxID=861788 RepID=A0AAN8LPG6_9TELE